MASMSAAVAESRAHFGKEAWGLVNCAGVMHYQYISDLDVESWAQASVIFFFWYSTVIMWQADVNCKGKMVATAA